MKNPWVYLPDFAFYMAIFVWPRFRLRSFSFFGVAAAPSTLLAVTIVSLNTGSSSWKERVHVTDIHLLQSFIWCGINNTVVINGFSDIMPAFYLRKMET
jgi:hypothetical protein